MGKQSMYGRIGVVLNRVPVGLGPPPPNCPGLRLWIYSKLVLEGGIQS